MWKLQEMINLGNIVVDDRCYEYLKEKADSVNQWMTKVIVEQLRLHQVC